MSKEVSPDSGKMEGGSSMATAEDCFSDKDDGIENFLSDAIGPDVDVLKGIVDSDTFAEIMDVVTASFTPSSDGSPSRRNSTTESLVNKTPPKKFESPLTDQDPAPSSSRKKCSPSKPPRTVNENKADTDPESTKEKIKNRLKVRLKFSPQQRSDEAANSTKSPKQKSGNPNPKSTSTPTKATPKKQKKAELAEISQQQAPKTSVIPKMGTSKRRINQDLHKKCIIKSKQMAGCTSCCIIMYNLLETVKFSEMVTPAPPNAQPKSSSTSVTLCSITDEKVDEFHEFERNNRTYYQKLFNPTKPPVSNKHVERKEVALDDSRKVKNFTSQQIMEKNKQNDSKGISLAKVKPEVCDTRKMTPSSIDPVESHHLEDSSSKNSTTTTTKKEPTTIESTIDGGHTHTMKTGCINKEENPQTNINIDSVLNEGDSLPADPSILDDVIKVHESSHNTLKDIESEGIQSSQIEIPLPSEQLKEKAPETKDIPDAVKVIQKGNTCSPSEKIKNRSTEEGDQGPLQILIAEDDEEDKKIAKIAKRRREKDETKRERDKKYERLEHERKRKSSDTKKNSKSDNRMASKITPTPTSFSLSPTKGLLMPSFRIPRAEGVVSKKITKPNPTPLEKVVEDEDDSPPRKFSRISKNKVDRNRRNSSSPSKSRREEPQLDSQQHPNKNSSNRDKEDEDWEAEVCPEADGELEHLWGSPEPAEPETVDNPGLKINVESTVEVTVADSPAERKNEEGKNVLNPSTTPDVKRDQPNSYHELNEQHPINSSSKQKNAEQDPAEKLLKAGNAADSVIMVNDVPPIPIEIVESETQLKVVPVDVDDGCESISPSDGDRTIPPITTLQIGRFAIAVTELAEKQADVDVITFEECFSRKCDNATTEKCAWWFAKCDKEPPFHDTRLPRLESVTSLCGSDDGSDASFLGNVSDFEIRDDDCQVYEISSTSQKRQERSAWGSSSKVVRDPDKVDEYCGRSLLQAKIRTSTGQNFRNLFDLRAGALYEKENFQAKCNLCNQLIVGKKDLATHVRGVTHKENLRKLDSHMDKTEKSTDSSSKKSTSGNSSSPKMVSIKKEKEDAKTSESLSKSKSPSKKHDKEDSKDKERKIKKEPEDKPVRVKTEPGGRVEYGTTSTGLSVKIPLDDDGKILRRSTKSPEGFVDDGPASSRSGGRHDSESQSPSKRRRRTRSRSPPVLIRRSPLGLRKSRRSRSRSPDRPRRHSRKSRSRSRSPNNRSSRRRRSDSEEYRHRRRSPGKSSRRGRRSRTKSKSPQLPKKTNKEFHAKLALTAEGKWTDEMEKQWKLMETEEAMFREQFIDRRKTFVATPEDHPRYGTEWTEFWERRYQEVEKEGKDPDTYNYVTEWKDYWSKRLNVLLQEEADEQILQIKRKYKMDFETLNLLRNDAPRQPPPPQQPERVFFDRQIRAPILNPTSFTTDSHSSNGHGSVVDFNLSAGMSMSSGNVIVKEEQSRIPIERKPSISVEDFKSTWEALTRPKSEAGSITDQPTKSAFNAQDSVFTPEFSVTTPFSQPPPQPNRTSIAASDITTSSSDGSFDFMGFDLVQVLRLMCKAEDQLSFLAPKILEYYKIAEELELKKSKGSLILLSNEELVTVMFQARDRFMTLIRSNVLGREILQTINLTVYGLNAILDAPQCQKFRPKVPAPFTDPAVAAVPVKSPTKPEDPSLPKIEPLAPPKYSGEEIKNLPSLVAHLSAKAKSVIAGELAKYLLLMGGQNMPNSELQEFVAKMVTPLVKKSNDSWEEKPDRPDAGDKKEDLNSAFDINRGAETAVLGHDYTHSFDMRITGVSGSKAVGSALPALPHASYKSGSLDMVMGNETPPRLRHGQSFETADRRPNNNYNSSAYDNLSSSHSSQQPQTRDADGRRSPFSRRDLPMNPVADRDRY